MTESLGIYHTCKEWLGSHQKELSTGLKIVGLALIMLALGSIAAVATLPDGNLDPQYMRVEFWEKRFFAKILTTRIAVGAMVLGGVLLAIGHKHSPRPNSTAVNPNSTMQEAKVEASSQKWKNRALISGIAIACFGAGLLAIASVYRDYVLKNINLDYYYPKDFWRDFNEKWILPVTAVTSLEIVGGVLTLGGGLGLILFGGGFAYLKKRWGLAHLPKSEAGL